MLVISKIKCASLLGLLMGLMPIVITAAEASSGSTHYVQSKTANVYEARRAGGPVVMRLKRGHKLIESYRQGSWIRVYIYGEIGKIGWVRSSDVGIKDAKSRRQGFAPSPQKSASEYISEGVIQARNKNSDEALKLFNQALEINPNHHRAHNNMGNIYRTRGQYERAIRSYQNAIKSNPSYAVAYANLARTLDATGKYQEAEKNLMTAIRINPNNDYIRNGLCVALKKQGKFDEAETACQKALSINAMYKPARFNLADIYRSTGRYEAAVKELERVLGMDPESRKARYMLYDVYRQLGRIEDAVRVLAP